MGIKEQIKGNPEKFAWLFRIYNRFLGHNKIRIKGKSKIMFPAAMLNHVKITVEGNQNVIEIGRLTRMTDSSIYIKGNNNRIIIDERNGFEGSGLWIEDDGNEILIGVHNRFFRNTHLAALEGTKISVGSDGLFAPDVQFRTSDSHSILNMEGRRINPAKDISVGNHVWMGAGVTVLKGGVIPDESVIGMNSLVNRKLDETNCVYAGSPVKKVKTGIKWNSERIINKSE